MAEYINREALIADIEESISNYWQDCGGYYLAEDVINESIKLMPAADVIKAKYGKWIINFDKPNIMTCSRCKTEFEEYHNEKNGFVIVLVVVQKC